MAKQRLQIIAFFTLIWATYLWLIPSQHTADAYGYAAAMGRGEFWSPHHLLYQPWVMGLSKVWILAGFQAIDVYAATNAAAMLLALAAVWKMLPSRLDKHWWVLVVAFSFATLRFGTENETYAWPLAFSLWGTERLLKGHSLLAAFLAAIAVLFHQMHVFWCLGLLLYAWRNGGWNFRWFYAGLLLSALAVLVLYRELALMDDLSVWAYVTHDAQEGLVALEWGPITLLLSLINLARSFIQVHASTLALFVTPWVSLFLIAGLLLGVGLLLGLRPRAPMKSMWSRPFVWVLICQFAFAVFSQGNAEFMVMLPALIVLEWSCQYRRNTQKPIMAMALGLLLWNGTTVGVGNACNSEIQLETKVSRLAQMEAEYSSIQLVYIARNKILIDNYMDYRKVAFKHLVIWKAPGYGVDAETVDDQIGDCAGNCVFITDSKRIEERSTRADLLGAESYNQWSDARQWDRFKAYPDEQWWVLRAN